MFAVFGLGCMELLILGGVVLGVGFLFRTRRLPHKALLILALLGLGLLFGVAFRALIDEHLPPVVRVLAFMGLLAVGVLFIAVMLRLFGLVLPRARPAAESARTDAPLTDRIGGLPMRAVLLSSLPLIVLAFLIGIAVWPPRRPDDVFAAIFAFTLCWTFLFALPFSLTVWLCRMSFRSDCPPVGRLKELLAERLPASEQARLTMHLEGCRACQHRVEGLTAGQHSWLGMARKLSEQAPSPGPALRKVIDSLKREEEPETSDSAPAFSGDLPLGFLSPADKPGQLGRLERYEVQEEIGRGGMGVVLKAFDPSLHRIVAIKVLAPQLATSGVARKRFLREAKAAAAVSHDHIVTIHAVDEANGLPYLVMQYVAGMSLQDRIDKEGPLELTEMLRIGMQTASGLAAAHAQGIVHRDIKPANILLEDGVQRVKITDFGLARAMDDASLTQSGFVAGSPLYMAPEQARGEAMDQRADLFSLGSVLYTMCTGRPPFRAANTLAVLRRVCEDAPRAIRETNPEVPDWLVDVVQKLMAKEPAERFQSASEVVEVLGRRLAQLQHAAWVPPPTPSPAPSSTEAGLPTSLTICPSCGASLHVPERMVGSLVHCAECGKPFHVEEGSEVIQVARAMKPPFGHGFRRRRRLPGCFWIAVGCLGLVLFIILFLWVTVRESRAPMTSRPAEKRASPLPPSQLNWKDALGWLPAEATFFGAINFNASEALTLDDPRTQALLRIFMSDESAKRMTPENLGRIRIERISLGYYEGPKSEGPHAIVHLGGVALDGHRRFVESLPLLVKPKLQIEELDKSRGANGPVRISGPDLDFAARILDDHSAFLAVSRIREAKASDHRKALDRITSAPPIPAGYNPPWVKSALDALPMDAFGFFIGEVPDELRKNLTEALGLRVTPRSIVCHLRRQGQGTALSLTLNVDKVGTETMLRDDLDKWRRQGTDGWRAKWPILSKEPQALRQLGDTVRTMSWSAERGCVRTQLHVTDATWNAVCAVLRQGGR